MKKCLVLYFVVLASFTSVEAQLQKADTAFLQTAIDNGVALYANTIKDQSNLYNGSEYVAPSRTNEQHAFFESDDWMIGNVNYDGQRYEGIPLMYDLTADVLVTELYNSNQIYLVSEKVKSFTLGKYMFERLDDENYDKTIPQTGFYQVLYKGPTKVVSRKQKLKQEKIVSYQLERNFKPRTRYYIFKDNKYYQVSSKGSIIKVLNDEQRGLKEFAKKNKIKYKQDPEGALVKLSEYYDTLKKNRS
jgi:hypothetical protein